MSTETFTDDAWGDVVGQPEAVALLRNAITGDPVHAWLFVGPHGSGKRAAARAFAGDLLAREHEAAGDHAAAARARDLARREQHPDLIVVEREGASITAEQGDDIIKRASLSANEGVAKVLLLDEFNLVALNAAARLLKTIEEPEQGTYFVILADEITDPLVTIASRCIQVGFGSISAAQLTARLEAEGIPAERAAEAASFAGGDLDRARLLATDERLALRLAAWRDLPRRLDGTGFRAAAAVDDLRAMIDDTAAPIQARHEAEIAELDERIERYGQRGSGKKELDARHKREVRRLRTDEIRMGLATLAGTYREELGVASDPTSAIGAITLIGEAAENLGRNANEELLLLALAMRLPPLM